MRLGWNAGYTAMERSVITLYDAGVLTKTVLEAVMEPYKDTDCDSGGSMNLRTKDGLDVEEVICKIMEPKKHKEVLQSPVWYEGEEPESGNNHGWHSNRAGQDLFWSIWHEHWGIF